MGVPRAFDVICRKVGICGAMHCGDMAFESENQ